ncbi:MAG: NAD(P)-binding domain-containing protein [Phycisphaeraceae bacterium]|nr:NAD(P)-binding domain-containing protein [Phycisphaeraceae bacterium]
MIQTPTIIVGAGPIGIELACALRSLGADYVHVDAGQIGQTIGWYPRQVKFFSSPERIAIAGLPLNTVDQSKATREEYLAYLRGVVQHYGLSIQTYERIESIHKRDDGMFELTGRRGLDQTEYRASNVVLAVGDMHRPRLLHIPGEELDHVSHYFDDPHRYFQRKLLIVGGRNSAVEAAIRCHRIGTEVTLSYRRHQLDRQSIKYWLMPEIQMLIDTGRIAFVPDTVPVRITPDQVTLRSNADKREVSIEAQHVLLLTGYEMDNTLLEMAGAKLVGENKAPLLDESTMMTTVPGLFVAGTAAAGTQLRFRLFIENCHEHVDRICRVITGEPPPFDAGNRTNAALAQRIKQAPES